MRKTTEQKQKLIEDYIALLQDIDVKKLEDVSMDVSESMDTTSIALDVNVYKI